MESSVLLEAQRPQPNPSLSLGLGFLSCEIRGFSPSVTQLTLLCKSKYDCLLSESMSDSWNVPEQETGKYSTSSLSGDESLAVKRAQIFRGSWLSSSWGPEPALPTALTGLEGDMHVVGPGRAALLPL